MSSPAVLYLGLFPEQEPFDVGRDEVGRIQYSVNFRAIKRASSTLLQELAAVLEAAGVGRRGESIFLSSMATIPPGPGPYLSLRETGGTAPLGTHNEGRDDYRQPTVQIIVRASSQAAAAAMAEGAYAALGGITNRRLTA